MTYRQFVVNIKKCLVITMNAIFLGKIYIFASRVSGDKKNYFDS